MAYVIFDKSSAVDSFGSISSIAIDDAALEKVSPSIIRHAVFVCTITEEQYNGLRMGIMLANHDGSGNATVENYTIHTQDPKPSYSESVVRSELTDYTTLIRKIVNGKVDEEDWLSYADSVDAIDLSGNTSKNISTIIENAGLTFRSTLQLPSKNV